MTRKTTPILLQAAPTSRRNGLPMLFAALITTLALASGTAEAVFTGPNGNYYLNNAANGTIYVVHGTKVVNQFDWNYRSASYSEGNLAIANGKVSTTDFGSYFGSYQAPSTAGEYTLSGTPTGTSYTTARTPGFAAEEYWDGTSDGRYNYTVQHSTMNASGNWNGEYVVRTDLQWQNPEILFSVATHAGAHGEYAGITYDPTTNSLWVSGWDLREIRNYSMTGTMLSSFSTNGYLTALAYDGADNTLWASYSETNVLYQYSTTGSLLQTGTPDGLPFVAPFGRYFSGEIIPEPTTLALLAITPIVWFAVRRQEKSSSAKA